MPEQIRQRRLAVQQLALRPTGLDPRLERVWASQVSAAGMEARMACYPEDLSGSLDVTVGFVWGYSAWGGSEAFQ